MVEVLLLHVPARALGFVLRLDSSPLNASVHHVLVDVYLG